MRIRSEDYKAKERIRRRKRYLAKTDEYKKKAAEWARENPEKRKEIIHRNYVKHIKEKAEYAKVWQARNREKMRAAAKRYAKGHPEKRREIERKRNEKCPERQVFRNAVQRMFLGTNRNKNVRSRQYIGCSLGFFRNHIESQFLPGMTWENHGPVWHVDHIVPVSWFPFDDDPSFLFVASHWTNLRPAWAMENMVKGNRYIA